MSYDPDVTTNGPLADEAPDGIKRVFVGIPDVYSTGQMARWHALNFVATVYRFSKDDPDDPTGAHIAIAQRIADFILDGTGGTP